MSVYEPDSNSNPWKYCWDTSKATELEEWGDGLDEFSTNPWAGKEVRPLPPRQKLPISPPSKLGRDDIMGDTIGGLIGISLIGYTLWKYLC